MFRRLKNKTTKPKKSAEGKPSNDNPDGEAFEAIKAAHRKARSDAIILARSAGSKHLEDLMAAVLSERSKSETG